MTLCKTMLVVLAAALSLPTALAAQSYEQGSEGLTAEVAPYEAGDFDGYPDFREIELRIQRQIDEAVREDRITDREAQDFLDDLEAIQDEEARRFGFWGWTPPVDARDKIRYALNRLSHEIDGKGRY